MKASMKAIRTNNNKTQEEAAKKLGVSLPTYRGWEDSTPKESNMPLKMVLKFCEVMKVTPEDLYLG